MNGRVTRRDLVAAVPAILTAPGVAAQRSPEQADPLEAARKRLADAARRLEEFELPMAAEPAFIFKP